MQECIDVLANTRITILLFSFRFEHRQKSMVRCPLPTHHKLESCLLLFVLVSHRMSDSDHHQALLLKDIDLLVRHPRRPEGGHGRKAAALLRAPLDHSIPCHHTTEGGHRQGGEGAPVCLGATAFVLCQKQLHLHDTTTELEVSRLTYCTRHLSRGTDGCPILLPPPPLPIMITR